MAAKKIGVGIVGASATRGWALEAHVPALRVLPDYEIRAVSTMRRETAEASARALGVELAFDDARALARHPEVDLVLVAVKAKDHFAPVAAALEAGKMVHCEWPLGRNLAEADELAALARMKRAKATVGLQGRFSPVVRYLRDLVGRGELGTVLGTSMHGTGGVWGGVVDASLAHLAAIENGSTLLSIPAGHGVDAMCFVLGELVTVTATLVARRGELTLAPSNETVRMTTHDQIAFSGMLESGALATVHYSGTTSAVRFLWQIDGTKGHAVVGLATDASPRYVNMADLRLRIARGDGPLEAVTIPAEYQTAPEGLAEHARNVGALYRQLAQDLAEGTALLPDFALAARRHRLIDAIERANATGQRQELAP